MAIRLRRLLFGAPHIARVAPHLQSPESPRRASGGFSLAQRFTAAAVGTREPRQIPAQHSSALGTPVTDTVLVLIQDPDHDATPELELARRLCADIRAVYVDEDPDQTQRLLTAWARNGSGVPLLVLEGDGLPVAASLRAYVDLLARECTTGEISIVLPVCESGTCRAKIRCVLRSLVARLALGGRPGVRVIGGGLAPARSSRTLAGCAVEA